MFGFFKSKSKMSEILLPITKNTCYKLLTDEQITPQEVVAKTTKLKIYTLPEFDGHNVQSLSKALDNYIIKQITEELDKLYDGKQVPVLYNCEFQIDPYRVYNIRHTACSNMKQSDIKSIVNKILNHKVNETQTLAFKLDQMNQFINNVINTGE